MNERKDVKTSQFIKWLVTCKTCKKKKKKPDYGAAYGQRVHNNMHDQ